MLHPVIREEVETAIQASLAQVREVAANNTQRIVDTEQRIVDMEEELQEYQARMQAAENGNAAIAGNLDDLKNRSRRNNILIIGLPETIKALDIARICKTEIPRALGIEKDCEIGRAHRTGNPKGDRQGPRQVIVKYTHYGDKAAILQKFRSSRSIQIEGTDILIFADYSIELSRKGKLFSRLCTQLHNEKIRFSLSYPAILNVTLTEGAQHSFYDHRKA